MIGMFVGCIIALLFYKAFSRPLITVSITPPTKNSSVLFTDYMNIYEDVDLRSSLSCNPTNNVLWSDILGNYNSTENYCKNKYGNEIPNFKEDACEGGYQATINVIELYYISSDTLIVDTTHLANELEDVTFFAWLTNANEERAARKFSLDMISDLSLNGALLVSLTDFNLYEAQVNQFLNTFLYETTIEGGDQAYKNIKPITDQQYQIYFEKSFVTKCTYTKKTGWLDVVSFAWNTTTTFFGGAVVIVGFFYFLIKKYQHKNKKTHHTTISINDIELKTTNK